MVLVDFTIWCTLYAVFVEGMEWAMIVPVAAEKVANGAILEFYAVLNAVVMEEWVFRKWNLPLWLTSAILSVLCLTRLDISVGNRVRRSRVSRDEGGERVTTLELF